MRKYGIPYQSQRATARKRNIEWCFTYDEWVEWWGEDIDRRGPYANDLCMGRYGDTGPYHPDNCYKTTRRENSIVQKNYKPLRYNGKQYRSMTDLANDLGKWPQVVRRQINEGKLEIEYVVLGQ